LIKQELIVESYCTLLLSPSQNKCHHYFFFMCLKRDT